MLQSSLSSNPLLFNVIERFAFWLLNPAILPPALIESPPGVHPARLVCLDHSLDIVLNLRLITLQKKQIFSSFFQVSGQIN